MPAKINLRKSKNSSNPWEYEIMSVRPMSNGKMAAESTINSIISIENSHGRTGWSILVEGGCCWHRCAERDIQGEH
jgi:hypothetical protein